MKKDLMIYFSNADLENNPCSVDAEQLTFEELVRIAKSKAFFNRILRYKDVAFFSPSKDAYPRPFLTIVICRILARGHCTFIADGVSEKIGLIKVIREFFYFTYEQFTYKSAVERVRQDVTKLEATPSQLTVLDFNGSAIYLRSDYSYGYIAGGSIGHIAGVLEHLGDKFTEETLFLSTDKIPTVNSSIPFELIKGKTKFRNIRDAASLFFNDIVYSCAKDAMSKIKPSMLYQRSGLNGYAGAKIAEELQIPFVLEYNGSEVWAAKNWGNRQLKTADLSVQIEKITFQKATLIVCVSQPLKDQLIEFGIPERKIIVNPNGVNTEKYNPNIDGMKIREKYGIAKDETVIGFIGTFGAWHGVEVLVQAFVNLFKKYPNDEKFRLFLIGDGIRMNEVKTIISKAGIEKRCVLSGMVPQQLGASYLAATDILVSPQVPNEDGTPFFGSPTKLFEYMAMGKAIAASDLDQIGEIIEHEKSGLLCKPGSVESLTDALEKLYMDKDLQKRLGKNARDVAVDKYTWKAHVERTMEKLKSLCQ